MNVKKILGIIAAMLVVAAAVIGAGCVAEQPSTPDVPEIPVENPDVTYTVTFAAGTGGTVSPGVVADVPEGSLIKVNGAMITVAGKNVTASAENGYEFSSWSAAVGAKDTSNMTITAEFTKVEKKKSNSGSSSGGNTAPVNAVEADENWTKNGIHVVKDVEEDRVRTVIVPPVKVRGRDGVETAELRVEANGGPSQIGFTPAVDEPTVKVQDRVEVKPDKPAETMMGSKGVPSIGEDSAHVIVTGSAPGELSLVGVKPAEVKTTEWGMSSNGLPFGEDEPRLMEPLQ